MNIHSVFSNYDNNTAQLSEMATPLRLKAHMLLVVPHAYDLAAGRYVFIET